jgi:hypothetical protein
VPKGRVDTTVKVVGFLVTFLGTALWWP